MTRTDKIQRKMGSPSEVQNQPGSWNETSEQPESPAGIQKRPEGSAEGETTISAAPPAEAAPILEKAEEDISSPNGRMKLRRILAIAGIILLLALYGINLILALMGTEASRQMLKLTLTLSIAVPILLYIMLMLIRKNPGQPKDILTDEQKIEIRRRMQGEEPGTSPDSVSKQAAEAKRLGEKAQKFSGRNHRRHS